MSQGIEQVGTLGAKHLGDPTVVRGWSADDAKSGRMLRLGAIMGKARGISLRSNQFADEPSVAFVGIFEGLGDDGRRVRAAACFLPKTINSLLAAAVVGDNKLPLSSAPKRGTKIDVLDLHEVKFAVEIFVKKTDSEIGFEYVTKMHGHDGFLISDPLEDLRQFIPGAALDRTALIEGPAAQAAIPPPAESPVVELRPAKKKTSKR